MSLAVLSRSQGMLLLALLIAFGWLAGVAIFLTDIYTDVSLTYLYPIKDSLIATILLTIAVRPNYAGRVIYGAVIMLLLVQAFFRLMLIAKAAPPSWMMFDLNILFILILLCISLTSIFRLIRIHNPALHKRIWRNRKQNRRHKLLIGKHWTRFEAEAKADVKRATETESEPDLIEPIWNCFRRNILGAEKSEPKAAPITRRER